MPTLRRAARAESAKQTDSTPTTTRASKRASAASAKADESTEESAVETKSPKEKRQVKPKEKKQAKEEAVVKKDEPPVAPTRPKLPRWAQFPLLSILSFSMASMGYSLLGAVTKGELASVSRSQDTWGEVAILAGWRLTELGVGWFGDLDSLDVAALDLLSHGPSLYLLSAFYGLTPLTARLALAIDILSAAAPFYLLRPLSAVHTPSAKVYNRELASWGMQLYTGTLATVIYSVIVVLSLRFLLPRVMVMYFAGIPTLEPAYRASYAAILPLTLQFGAAASLLIYAPFATTGKAAEDDKIDEFDPATATLRETVAWNFLGYTAKTRVIVRRTAVVVLVTCINTYLACTMTIFGIEPAGAAAYAAVWASAALLSGLGLAFVGGI